MGVAVANGMPMTATGDATGGVIPYKNPPALIAYYCGIFSLLPILGLVFGIALAAFLEYRDSSFRSQQDVASVLSLPVLAQIPFIITPAEQREIGKKRLLIAAAAAAMSCVVGVVLWRLGILNGLLRLI